MRSAWVLATALLLGFGQCPTHAATATGSLGVQITITADCSIAAGAVLNFGSTGVIDVNIDDSTALSVTCTSGTTYSIGLNAGANAATLNDVNTRRMEASSQYVSYQLYRLNDHTTVWGNSIGTDTVSSTGTGSAQSFTVYGRVPPQATPAPTTYNDTISVTVTF